MTRSFIVTIIPGIFAVFPWALFSISFIDDFSLLYKTYPLWLNLSLLGAAIMFGMISEGIMTRVEIKWDDNLTAKKYWHEYLSFQFKNEPVGIRYISKLVTFFKFELNMIIVAPISIIGGIALLIHSTSNHKEYWISILFVGAVISTLLFIKKAKNTHSYICEIRKSIMDQNK